MAPILAEQQEIPTAREARDGAATIQGWSVVGYDRIVGMVREHPDDRAKAIMTSPVVRVTFVGRTPIALTQSGSVYMLGPPAESFGADRAQHFLLYKSGATLADSPQAPAPRLPTTVMKLET